MYLKAEFTETRTAANAIEDIKGRGLGADDVEIFSTEPVIFAPGVLDRPTSMSLVAVCGALTIGALATWLVYYAQHSYPLVTGGMPIFSFWASGVVTFELTMLGSIITTFGWFLWESKLFSGDRKAPIPDFEPGSIVLRVRCGSGKPAELTECLRRAGATRVETLGDRS